MQTNFLHDIQYFNGVLLQCTAAAIRGPHKGVAIPPPVASGPRGMIRPPPVPLMGPPGGPIPPMMGKLPSRSRSTFERLV